MGQCRLRARRTIRIQKCAARGLLAAGLLAAGIAPVRGLAAPRVWVASSLERVGQTQSPGENTAAEIWAARGEYESFQIVVRAPASGLSGVNVTVSDFTGPGDARIPQANLTLYREHYVSVNRSSPDWHGRNRPLGPGWYADGLIPFRDPVTGKDLQGAALDAVPFRLAAGRNQPIWVDVLVPRNAQPGLYTASYTVTSDQGRASGIVTLHVWNFTLPLQPALHSSFGFWKAGSVAAKEELLRNRLEPDTVPLQAEGQLAGTLGLGATDLGFWSGADVGQCSMSAAPDIGALKAAAARHRPGILLYNYTADEIDDCPNLYHTMRQWAANLHRAGVKNLVTMAPVPALYDDGSRSGRSAVDIWAVLPLMYDNSIGAVQHVLAKGDAVWSYNTLVQDDYSPKWEIDFAPIDYRIQPGFINQSLGLTGLLYWRVDHWKSDAWNDVNNSGEFSEANYPGEGMLVYPGAPVGIAGVAPSMRLKWLRDGVDDYDYIELLKKKGKGAWALDQARRVGPDWVSWTRDPSELEAVRRALGDELDRLNGGSPAHRPPAAPANPRPANGAAQVSPATALGWSRVAAATSYVLYFGTSPMPPRIATPGGAAYHPGPLKANTRYYWRVVARNQAGAASSPVWSFTTAAPPAPDPGSTGEGDAENVAPDRPSVTPKAGRGWRATFTLRYPVPADGGKLAGGYVLLANQVDGRNACWVYYERQTNWLWLASDDTRTWRHIPIDSSRRLWNRQCVVFAQGSSARFGSGGLTVALQLRFRRRFRGTKTLYLLADTGTEQDTDYQAAGTWTVSASRRVQTTQSFTQRGSQLVIRPSELSTSR